MRLDGMWRGLCMGWSVLLCRGHGRMGVTGGVGEVVGVGEGDGVMSDELLVEL